ncbi:Dpy-30 motif family protein [Tritrichomonas foetus]|uniref:Dpy-30 motif family protein n=1 Tax=Tritrichomonas foetus TaxID=1144522 RepID=A0A1J4KNP4_9EUKA|nr:Dpy-30 motif family protein [Tritrichomonas foetus]|eukprot:OHT12536.1 Dpy-30 motif family protein [Tritrichomonas foetus]
MEEEQQIEEQQIEEEQEAVLPEVDQAIIQETERLEQLAANLPDAIPVRSLPKQEYLQATVVPIILEGMAWVIKERPEDPVENLAMFLIKNNPNSPELHRKLDISHLE